MGEGGANKKGRRRLTGEMMYACVTWYAWTVEDESRENAKNDGGLSIKREEREEGERQHWKVWSFSSPQNTLAESIRAFVEPEAGALGELLWRKRMEEDAISERREGNGSKAVVRNSGNSFFQGLEEEDDLVRRETRKLSIV